MGGLVAAMFAEIAVITWRALGAPIPGTASPAPHQGPPLPFPSQYAAAFAIYGGLGLLAGTGEGGGSVANLVGWGLVLATALNLVSPQGKPNSGNGSVTTPNSNANVAANSALGVGGYVGATPPSQIPGYQAASKPGVTSL